MHTTWVEVSRHALLHNLHTLQRRVAPAQVMAVVKGNAYGHGLREVASVLRGETAWFGVNALHEAQTLAGEGHAAPILILGNTPPEGAEPTVRGGFRQAVYDHDAIFALADAATALGATARVHLKVETGTNRQGLHGTDLRRLAACVRSSGALELEGLYTHYANVEEADDFGYAAQQLARFHTEVAQIEADAPVPLKHTACSAAAILYPQTYFGMVRVGISLYGLWPSETTRRTACAGAAPITLRPALSWKCRVAQVKDVAEGETVGYGCTHRTARPTRLAVLPVGYYEGLDRGLSGNGDVLIRGQRAPIIGRVCMNMCMVDVTAIAGARAGDEAVLIGTQGAATLTAEAMAARLGTINYEVVTRIGASVPRVLV